MLASKGSSSPRVTLPGKIKTQYNEKFKTAVQPGHCQGNISRWPFPQSQKVLNGIVLVPAQLQGEGLRKIYLKDRDWLMPGLSEDLVMVKSDARMRAHERSKPIPTVVLEQIN